MLYRAARFAEVNSEVPVLKGELSRVKKTKHVLEKKVESMTEANANLALELRESMPSAIFSRATPIGKNAFQIRARVNDFINLCEKKSNLQRKTSIALRS